MNIVSIMYFFIQTFLFYIQAQYVITDQ